MAVASEARKDQMRAYYQANKHRWNTVEHRANDARWRRSNRGRRNRTNAARRRRNREFVYEVKSGPCSDCGQTFPPYVMDFDHVTGDKSSAISALVDRGVRLERIQAELKKCELVCANCHRVRTHERRTSNGETE